ncbi:MAG: methyltransferase, TrmH family [Actinomycetota bacterium]|jgi:TrmH family RNA methyltransferase|nr:methyltransferase, TrmH family [Actinomycetota bacterium]
MAAVQLEGFHAVKHTLRFASELIDTLTITDVDAVRRLAPLAPDIIDELLARATVGGVEHPTGVEGTARRPAEDRSVLTSRRSPLVLLDEPRHPGNAGAVIRVAAAAGASGVAMTGTLDPWQAAVVRGSAGLHFALPVLHVDPDEVTGPLLVLDAEGDEGWQVPDDAVLVVGSERDGVTPHLRERADAVIRLPMTPGVSSLNLATAAAAVLYHWRLRP